MRCLVEGKPIDPDALTKQSDEVQALFRQVGNPSRVKVSDIVGIIGGNKGGDGGHNDGGGNGTRVTKSYFR